MLEILLLRILGKKIAANAKAKGRKGTPYVVLLVLLWFLGEFFGGFAGAIFSGVFSGDGEPNIVYIYGGAVASAIIGAIIAFGIVSALPHLQPVEFLEEDLPITPGAEPTTPVTQIQSRIPPAQDSFGSRYSEFGSEQVNNCV